MASVKGTVWLSPIDSSGIRTLVLNRVDRANALDDTLVHSLISHVRDCYQDRPRMLVLKAEGRHFCSGLDLSYYDGLAIESIIAQLVRISHLLSLLRRAPFVTVACVQGAAYGAGGDLAIACTYRFACRNAAFRFPGFQFGLALGTKHLVSIVGKDFARDVLLTNRVVLAEEAFVAGLVTRLVNDEREFAARIEEIATSLSRLDSDSVAHLLSVTSFDKTEAEAADLLTSLMRSDLHDRIVSYAATLSSVPRCDQEQNLLVSVEEERHGGQGSLPKAKGDQQCR